MIDYDQGRKHVINPYLIQVVSGVVMLTGCAEKSALVHNSESTYSLILNKLGYEPQTHCNFRPEGGTNG